MGDKQQLINKIINAFTYTIEVLDPVTTVEELHLGDVLNSALFKHKLGQQIFDSKGTLIGIIKSAQRIAKPYKIPGGMFYPKRGDLVTEYYVGKVGKLKRLPSWDPKLQDLIFEML